MRKLKSAKSNQIKLTPVRTERKMEVKVVEKQPVRTSYTGWCGGFYKATNRMVAVVVKHGNVKIKTLHSATACCKV